VNSLPLATIYEVKIPLRKWKKSLLQRNPAQMTRHIVVEITSCGNRTFSFSFDKVSTHFFQKMFSIW
jgi:hypothetical protein